MHLYDLHPPRIYPRVYIRQRCDKLAVASSLNLGSVTNSCAIDYQTPRIQELGSRRRRRIPFNAVPSTSRTDQPKRGALSKDAEKSLQDAAFFGMIAAEAKAVDTTTPARSRQSSAHPPLSPDTNRNKAPLCSLMTYTHLDTIQRNSQPGPQSLQPVA